MNAEDALQLIIDARDHYAEYNEYPPDTVRVDQGFDDWAADLAAETLGRRNGRTTRMLQRALKFAREQKAVYVVGIDDAQVQTLKSQMEEILRAEGGAPNDPVMAAIKFEPLSNYTDDPYFVVNLRTRSSWPNCVWLIDHFACERFFHHYAGLRCMQHAFDRRAYPGNEPGEAYPLDRRRQPRKE